MPTFHANCLLPRANPIPASFRPNYQPFLLAAAPFPLDGRPLLPNAERSCVDLGPLEFSVSASESPTESLTARLRRQALQLGFGMCGFAPAIEPTGLSQLSEWLAAGYAGEMHYLSEHAAAYSHPQHLLEGVRTVVMLSLDYRTAEPAPLQPGQGRVSRYAWGTADYHNLIRDRLHQLADWLRREVPTAKTRGVVDTAPLLEREFARQAGLGWIGKNSLLLSRSRGSYFFLAALLTDLQLEYDAPHATDHCGTCTACLDACPTNAFPQPYVLDASRCISYLTIELRGQVPRELRAGMGDWVFGCDVCQDVCPWNRHSQESPLAEFQPQRELDPVDLASLFDLDEAEFRRRFRHTPLWRAHRRGLLRSAAIALGNRPSAAAVPALIKGLNDVEAIVRGASAWALGNYRDRSALDALQARRIIEPDGDVCEEIESALAEK